MRSCEPTRTSSSTPPTSPVERHELKLTLLGDLVAHAADPDEVIIFIDGDAFPIAPIMPFLRSKLERYPLVAVRRDENNGDRQPHPSFCATTAGFWRELPGDWRRGHTWINPQGKEVTDVGGNLLGLLEDAGHRVVSDAAHQQGQPASRSSSGSTRISSTTTAAAFGSRAGGGCGGRRSRTGSTRRLRGRLAARLPRDGHRGPDPEADRPRAALPAGRSARSWLRVNEQVFELIRRDETFYLQLIEPDRGGELAALEAPVLLEDAAELSP